MTQKTATEKDQFLQSFDRECQTTLKLLKAYPANQGDFKPNEKLRSAKDLTWTFVQEQGLADHALSGKMDFTKKPPKAPENYSEVIAAFETMSRQTKEKVSKASDESLNRTVPFPTGPGKMGDIRVMDVLWFALMDQIHHRGQFSVYMRLTGAKVPSIYGPSADEPWM